MNTSHAPTAATSTPAIAGPIARDTLMAMLLSAIAAGISSTGTSSGTIAAHAGIIIAAPTPSAKVNPSNIHGVIISSHASGFQACRQRPSDRLESQSGGGGDRRYRQSHRQAARAASPENCLRLASTSATIDGDDESDVINQPAPTSCIQVPMFETMVAIHSPRKSACRSGLHGELVARAPQDSHLKLHRQLIDVAPAPILSGLE
jgi:hypothetical protein